MNVYLAKFMTYYEIHRLHREGHSVSWISSYLGLNRRTVSKYLSMSEQGYEQFLENQTNRNRRLDPYEEFVRQRLESHRDTTAAQMHDWLKEYHQDFPSVSQKTVFNFVGHVRKKHQLPVVKTERQFLVVEELPYGKQAQVDFGEYNMRTSQDKRVKVYFFTLVLSRSRYKYVWFTDRPFTAELAIQAHELAFDFITGIPDEMVYDQDKVFMVSENHGDFILTSAFKAYTQGQSFTLHFCRKADPQSKGKVENVVKYVKQNFLYNRTYHNVETLNDEVINWLSRTANALPHASTQKVPYDEWVIERAFLKPFQACNTPTASLSLYTVRKDNTISYQGNFYSLPLGTYEGKGTQVALHIHEGYLIISEAASNQELTRHRLAVGKGQKVINTDHQRDKTALISEMIEQVAHLISDAEKAKGWLEGIKNHKPRYVRDQLMTIREAIKTTDITIIDQVVDYCCKNSILSASDFKAIIEHLKADTSQKQTKIITLNPLNGQNIASPWQKPHTSSINDYQQIIENNKQNG